MMFSAYAQGLIDGRHGKGPEPYPVRAGLSFTTDYNLGVESGYHTWLKQREALEHERD